MPQSHLFQYQPIADPIFTGGETIFADKWIYPWSEPKRFKRALPTALHPFAFWDPNIVFPETITYDKWGYQWSEPIVKQKVGLDTGSQQTLAFQFPHVSFSWMEPLSEPKRFKKGLKTPLQQFLAQDTDFVPHPDEILEGWFNWLSEPKRFPKGLKVFYQQAYVATPRMLPNPNITVTMEAIETNSDDALMAVNVVRFNTPATAKVSLTEIGGGSATSIIESS